MRIDKWHYLHGKPTVSGIFKYQADDFIVREILGYTPQGEGEHIYLWVRKQGLNTAYLAEQIAKFAQLPLRSVSYAGRKDKHAITEQWFGVHKPGKAEYDWSALNVPGAEVLKAVRHNKKLRTGVLKGNSFTIKIRGLSHTQGLKERIDLVNAQGVPNYFGPQRFGDSKYDPSGSNLVLAQKMIDGQSIHNRNKRSMAISALRSWLFNEMVSGRIQAHHFSIPLPGDVMSLAGSGSFFTAPQIDPPILARLAERDIQISAPLWGEGNLPSEVLAEKFEQDLANSHPKIAQTLCALGLKQERRPISLFTTNLQWQLDNDQLSMTFELPAGTFATSVLREIVNIDKPDQGTIE
ncbi:MAG: tRNA pseudouridine13 synthase [Paraglaciecola sp.]|jgi:tRNA pseudouridine13 synthase